MAVVPLFMPTWFGAGGPIDLGSTIDSLVGWLWPRNFEFDHLRDFSEHRGGFGHPRDVSECGGGHPKLS